MYSNIKMANRLGEEVAELDPKFLPRDWDDEERMNFMFSAFPKDRGVNPKHWDSKMAYWVEEAKRSCSFYKDICVTCEMLRDRFRRSDRVPRGFSIVFNDLVQQGILVEPGKILNHLDNGWMKWSSRLITNSLTWFWKSEWVSNSSDESKEFIFYEILQQSAMELLTKHHQRAKVDGTDHVVPWNVVKELYRVNNKRLDDQELLYVIAFLKSKGLADLASNEMDEKLVKFAKSATSSVAKINENDWNIVRLKKVIAKLKLEIADNKKEIAGVKSAAQACIKTNDKSQAKRLICQKQKLEKTLNIKQDSLMTLTDQLCTIQNSESTKMIVDAINSSSSLLNNSLREDGLSPQKVDDVFERNVAACELAKEIDSSISEGFRQLDDDIDLEDLENELSELLSEKDGSYSTDAAAVMDLPTVPMHSPGLGSKQKAVKGKAKVLAS